MKVAHETLWRKDLNSLNYIEASTRTQQEHNRLYRPNLCFIGSVLNLKISIRRVYFPARCEHLSPNSRPLSPLKELRNLIVSSEAVQTVWLTAAGFDANCKAGASIWKFASTDDGIHPDVVLVVSAPN